VIIDALKVTRTVLENALSGASMFLSITATVNDELDDKSINKSIEY
jgi:chaperonin GroEL (HSP60 family)